jgi:hypothetical protein
MGMGTAPQRNSDATGCAAVKIWKTTGPDLKWLGFVKMRG